MGSAASSAVDSSECEQEVLSERLDWMACWSVEKELLGAPAVAKPKTASNSAKVCGGRYTDQ